MKAMSRFWNVVVMVFPASYACCSDTLNAAAEHDEIWSDPFLQRTVVPELPNVET